MYSGCSEVVVKGHMVCHILRLLSFVVLIYVRCFYCLELAFWLTINAVKSAMSLQSSASTDRYIEQIVRRFINHPILINERKLIKYIDTQHEDIYLR